MKSMTIGLTTSVIEKPAANYTLHKVAVQKQQPFQSADLLQAVQESHIPELEENMGRFQKFFYSVMRKPTIAD